MQLRPYQEESRSAVQNEWENNKKKTSLVLPAGWIWMKIYWYESSKNTGCWTEGLDHSNKKFEKEKGYLMVDDPEEDETVKLVTIEVINVLKSLRMTVTIKKAISYA